ncbi:hypothetical protein CLV24_11542 [Pontibacter ummariensis]|uniref:Transposase IS200 like n=1 Tax=Pontibacter ummariensis TaxID=1610492 RepID=A0A239I235_9BACT|nr:hypothetical protein CLV24_11542 [Pontibacter ummariensis]SNS86424.1 hypothetical protein SAMN06296052_11542 [Pontibacter ummariensis]
MAIYAWCIMLPHVHFIFRTRDNNPSVLLKELKCILLNSCRIPQRSTCNGKSAEVETHPRPSKEGNSTIRNYSPLGRG